MRRSQDSQRRRRTTVGKSREVCLQAGELLWTQIEPCRVQRFQVFAFTNAPFIFRPQAYEACSFSEDYPSDEINHEWTRIDTNVFARRARLGVRRLDAAFLLHASMHHER